MFLHEKYPFRWRYPYVYFRYLSRLNSNPWLLFIIVSDKALDLGNFSMLICFMLDFIYSKSYIRFTIFLNRHLVDFESFKDSYFLSYPTGVHKLSLVLFREVWEIFSGNLPNFFSTILFFRLHAYWCFSMEVWKSWPTNSSRHLEQFLAVWEWDSLDPTPNYWVNLIRKCFMKKGEVYCQQQMPDMYTQERRI